MNWSSHEFIWLDWVVLIVGLLGVVAAVWYAIWKDKKAQQGEDSSAYLFGKGEPWYVIGMAIFAANIGSEHLVGLAGTGAKDGVGMAHWEMQGWMILILGWLFVPFYQLLINKMGKIITMPDFLKFRYTQRTGSWLSIITLVAYVLTKVSVTAFTGGIFFKFLLGIPFWYGAIGLIAITAGPCRTPSAFPAAVGTPESTTVTAPHPLPTRTPTRAARDRPAPGALPARCPLPPGAPGEPHPHARFQERLSDLATAARSNTRTIHPPHRDNPSCL